MNSNSNAKTNAEKKCKKIERAALEQGVHTRVLLVNSVFHSSTNGGSRFCAKGHPRRPARVLHASQTALKQLRVSPYSATWNETNH